MLLTIILIFSFSDIFPAKTDGKSRDETVAMETSEEQTGELLTEEEETTEAQQQETGIHTSRDVKFSNFLQFFAYTDTRNKD